MMKFLQASLPLLLLGAALPAYAGLASYDLELKNGMLAPQTLEVVAGERFKLNLHNTGESPVEFESPRLRQEKVLAPGADSFVVLPPLQKGEYEFFDEFHLPDAKGRIIAQ